MAGGNNATRMGGWVYTKMGASAMLTSAGSYVFKSKWKVSAPCAPLFHWLQRLQRVNEPPAPMRHAR